VSWDACLELAADPVTLADWNYTHNTNGMIAAAYEAVSGEATDQCGGPLGAVIGAAWWKRLDGSGGKDGAAYLSQIVSGLEASPERFRAMNPENGWGDYDRLLTVLREMRDTGAQFTSPTVWRVSG
jgi:hypothetical protein